MASQRTILSFSRSVAAKVCAVVSATLALAVLASPALACRGTSLPPILFGAIPTAAVDIEVIANVEIIDVQMRQRPGLLPFAVARALVLKSIRGTADGQVIEMFAQGTMCGGGLDLEDVGLRGFIAGRFIQVGSETLFDGRLSYAQAGDVSAAPWRVKPWPWWRASWSKLWHTFYTPWYYRGPLIVLVLYLLWLAAGWLDRCKGKA
jgi:hypothetical protein